uniref:oxygenase MpaB family protein n=2 Tax=Roseivirga sp. TaxID=1964215 RepID=UPI0040473CE1
MYSQETLDGFRLQGDALADAAIDSYFPQRKQELQLALDSLQNNSTELPSSISPELRLLYEHVFQSLSSSESAQIEAGQRFFSKNASDIMLLLGFLSLPYCYAAAKGAEVLGRSNRIISEPGKRLIETAEFVFDITQPNAFAPEGRGFVSVFKVRLIHAAIRWYINHSGKWDQAYFGVPVNQEDLAGTNLSFSLIAIRGLNRLGIIVLTKESEAYIQFWNVIGARLGLHKDLLPKNNKESFLLEKRIRERHFESSEVGQQLTQSLLKYFETVTINSPLEGKSKSFVQFLLGDKVSQILGIEVDQFSRASFKPFYELMKVKNLFLRKDDNYLAAFSQFNKSKQQVSDDSMGLSLPKNTQ